MPFQKTIYKNLTIGTSCFIVLFLCGNWTCFQIPPINDITKNIVKFENVFNVIVECCKIFQRDER